MPIDVTKIVVSTTIQMRIALDVLVNTGLFGVTREEVAERLICERLIVLVEDNWTQVSIPGDGDA